MCGGWTWTAWHGTSCPPRAGPRRARATGWWLTGTGWSCLAASMTMGQQPLSEFAPLTGPSHRQVVRAQQAVLRCCVCTLTRLSAGEWCGAQRHCCASVWALYTCIAIAVCQWHLCGHGTTRPSHHTKNGHAVGCCFGPCCVHCMLSALLHLLLPVWVTCCRSGHCTRCAQQAHCTT